MLLCKCYACEWWSSKKNLSRSGRVELVNDKAFEGWNLSEMVPGFVISLGGRVKNEPS